MTRRSWIVLTAVGVPLGATLVVFGCGGGVAKEFGYLDDAGVYHAEDGSVLFVPGSACVGFDGSTVPVACTDTTPAGEFSDPACLAWVAQLTPPGYPVWTTLCQPDGPNPDASAHCQLYTLPDFTTPTFVRCPEVSAAGTQFCSAWLQQFVSQGHTWSACEELDIALQPPAQNILTCGVGGPPTARCPDGTSCTQNTICVTADGTNYKCVEPCSQ